MAVIALHRLDTCVAGLLCEILDAGPGLTTLGDPAGPAVAVRNLIGNAGKERDLTPADAEFFVFKWPTCRAVDDDRAEARHRWEAVQFGDDKRMLFQVVDQLLTVPAREMQAS